MDTPLRPVSTELYQPEHAQSIERATKGVEQAYQQSEQIAVPEKPSIADVTRVQPVPAVNPYERLAHEIATDPEKTAEIVRIGQELIAFRDHYTYAA